MAFNLIGNDEPLVIREGTDISIDITLEDENGPLDLTGYSANMRFGPDLETAAELTVTVGSGLTITPLEGKINFTLTNVQTAAFTFTQGRYDLEIVDGSGLIDPVIYGKVTIVQKVPN